jgi:hypothetical protein
VAKNHFFLFNYIIGRDFLGLASCDEAEQSKFQLEFKGIAINLDLNCQLNHLQKT